MKLDILSRTIAKLEELVRTIRFEPMQTATLEIKPVPPNDGDWKEIYKSICALLNSRGGYLILGIRECNAKEGEPARYEFPGWDSNCESKLKDELWGKFTDRRGDRLDIRDMLERLILRPFPAGPDRDSPGGRTAGGPQVCVFRREGVSPRRHWGSLHL